MADMPPKLAEIVDEFASAPRDVVLEMLLEFADVIPPLPDDAAGHEGMEQVPECQTAFFLRAEVTPDGTVRPSSTARRRRRPPGRSPASSPKGLAGASAEEVLAVPDDLYQRMGLAQAISPLRVRGGTAILARLKRQVAGTDSTDGRLPPIMEIEIYADVVCPWCYIGKRRLEQAIASLRRRRDRPVPAVPARPVAGAGAPADLEALADKFGGPGRAPSRWSRPA